jgi:hypothetical protein
MIKVFLFSLVLIEAVWYNLSIAGTPIYPAQTPEEARSIAVQQLTGGRALAVEEMKDGYRVKVLTQEGKVIFIFVERR